MMLTISIKALKAVSLNYIQYIYDLYNIAGACSESIVPVEDGPTCLLVFKRR